MSLIRHTDGTNVVPVWINGSALPLDSSKFLPVHSALKDSIVHHAQGASPETATLAADTAARTFRQWSTTDHITRRELLLKVADIYERRAEEIVEVQVQETSCTESYARFNIDLACRSLWEFAGSLTHALKGDVPPMTARGFGFVFKEAIGPVLIIPPWNSSIILSTRGVAAAIAAGCTVVLKSSELCPRTHLTVVEAFEEAGLPAGCLDSLQAARADAGIVTETLIKHEAIRKIEFIGSAGVGAKIGEVAARYLKPVLMELGGKGPAIVLKDADLQKAAELCAFGAFLHHGQICFSTERIIVEEAVSARFISFLQAEVKAKYSEPVGQSVTSASAQKAKGMLDAACTNGASLLAGSNTFFPNSNISLTPTVITNVQESDAMFDEETFGPSASLYVVPDVASAVELANKSKYGLNASIHSADVYAALKLARQLDYGQVHINSPTTYDQETMPVTGAKASGWGSNNGEYGIGEFLVNKSVTVLGVQDAGVSFGT